MKMSEQINELATALALAQGEFPTVKKDSLSGVFKGAKYADLATVIEGVRAILPKHGLSVVQLPSFSVEHSCVILTTMLLHKSGQFISEELAMPLMDIKAQSLGSGMAYARRYSFQSILCLAADDDDGETASGRAAGMPEPPPTPPRVGKPQQRPSASITEPQQKRLFAIARSANASVEDIKAVIKKCGYDHSAEIKAADYETICDLFQSGRWADALTKDSGISDADLPDQVF